MGTVEYDLDVRKKNPKAITPSTGYLSLPNSEAVRIQDGYFSAYGALADMGRYSQYSNLSIYDIEKIYEGVSIIRAIHDVIVQRIESLNWTVVSKNPEKPAPEMHIKKVTEYFENPNENDQTLQEINSLVVKDLLKFDVGVLEKTFNTFGEFSNQIYPQYSPEFYKLISKNNKLLGYVQLHQQNNLQKIPFEKDELIYMSMYATTKKPNGIPKMFSIVDEIGTFIFANDYVRSRFDKSQIPTGILALESLSGEMDEIQLKRYERKNEIEAETQKKDIKINTIEGKANWIELTGSDKSSLMIDLLLNSCKQIFAAYGVDSTAFSQVGDTNRATAIVKQSIEQSTIIRPIIIFLKRYYNKHLVWKHWYDDVMIDFEDLEELDPKTNLEITLGLESQKIITKNEARKNFGYKPYTDKELAKAEGESEETEQSQNKDDKSQSKEEKDSSDKLRQMEGTEKYLNLVDVFKTEYQVVEEYLLSNMTKAYFNDGGTNNVITASSSSLYGKFKKAIDDSKINNLNIGILKEFADRIEPCLKFFLKNYEKSNRTRKWGSHLEREKMIFSRKIKRLLRIEFYNEIDDLAAYIMRGK